MRKHACYVVHVIMTQIDRPYFGVAAECGGIHVHYLRTHRDTAGGVINTLSHSRHTFLPLLSA
jgi:hypothetical protein